MRYTAREAWLGFTGGFVGAVVFAIAAIAVAVAGGESATYPFRLFASLWFGALPLRSEGLDAPRADDVVLIGTFVHLAIAILGGALYALIDTALSRRPLRLEHHVLLGAGYGVVLWLVNFQLLGRLVYPWLLELPQGPIAILHVLGYGMPLGLVYGALEHRRALRFAPS